MVLPKRHYCKYIYIDVIYDVSDPGHLFTCGVNPKASVNKSATNFVYVTETALLTRTSTE